MPCTTCLQVVIRDILLGEPASCDGLLCEAFGPAANIDAGLLIIVVAVLACAPLLTMRWVQEAVGTCAVPCCAGPCCAAQLLFSC
jgi:hypothetical protein